MSRLTRISKLVGGQALRVYLALALALVGITLLLNTLGAQLGLALLVPYLVLVALAARWGGLAAAIFVSLASLPLVDFFLFEPIGRLGLGTRQLNQFVLVLLAGLLLGWLMDDLRVARERSERAEAAARQALQERDALVSVIAHDLRSPLTAVRARVQLAETFLNREPPEVARALSTLAAAVPQVDRVNRLLNDLLAGADGQGPAFSVQPTPFHFADLLTRVVERWRTDAPHHPIELDAAGALPVVGDAGRLEQVLDNLIGNAVKYSPQGSPILVRAWDEDGEVRISVTDRGAGIPAEELPLLFGRFYRRPEHRLSRQPGLGLGLYITRELVRAHGGRIWVDSTVGSGTTFTVALPRQVAPPVETPSELAAQHAPGSVDGASSA